MEITLPKSGKHVTLRDTFLRGDRRRAKPGNRVVFAADGTRYAEVPSDDEVIGRILRDMIVAWDVPQPLPRDAQTEEMAQGILDTLDDDDYAEMAKAVMPFFRKVMGTDGQGAKEDPNSPSSATGTPSSAAQDGQETLTI